MAKIGLQLKGFEDLMEDLDRLGGDLKQVTTEALEKSHAYVTPNIQQAMQKHHRTGRTESTIDTSGKVTWKGDVASVDVGFDISGGGLASVFLMYGTKVYGTPRTKKDTKLYNSIYGSATKKKLAEIQEDIILGAIEKRI